MLGYWINVIEVMAVSLGTVGGIYESWKIYKQFKNRYYRRLESK